MGVNSSVHVRRKKNLNGEIIRGSCRLVLLYTDALREHIVILLYKCRLHGWEKCLTIRRNMSDLYFPSAHTPISRGKICSGELHTDLCAG
jgi:hypothetical protein